MEIINARGMSQRELCDIVKKERHQAIEIRNCCGQRYIGCGMKDASIMIIGTPGNALGAFLDSGTIRVDGNAQRSYDRTRWYDESYSWKEHPEAKESNKLHGQYSVEMAERAGIELTEEQKAVIEGHSKGEYPSKLGQIIKIAEVCRATEMPRWYRGEKKEPAKSWEEVYSVLREDKLLDPTMIALAGNSYGVKHFTDKEQDKEEILK